MLSIVCCSYCNSVLQALYYCKPFRECLTNYPHSVSTLAATNHNHQTGSPNQSHSLPPLSPGLPKSHHIAATSPGSPTGMRTNGHSSLSSSTYNSPALSNKSLPRNGLHGMLPERLPGSVNLSPGLEDTLFAALKDLFWEISTHRKKTGVVAPVNFINKVKKENGKL